MGQENPNKNISIEDFSYDLPVDKIAKYPLTKRTDSKLLLYKDSEVCNKKFTELPELLLPNDILVFNNTKVIQARIPFYKKTGAKIEIFCLEPHLPEDFQLSFESREKCEWKCMVGNLKKWKDETIENELKIEGEIVILKARKIERNTDNLTIEFSWNNDKFSFAEILELSGIIPIPPYLNRDTEESDLDRYQTVYSKIKGSVAAPTAGLHFTEDIFSSISAKNIHKKEITLHVSAGTFKPVSSDKISDHEMHSEHFYVTREFIQDLSKKQRRIIAVGTTSVRTIESLYWIGEKLVESSLIDPNNIHVNQWDPYEFSGEISVKESMENILNFMDIYDLNELIGTTQIIIVPGYKFKIVEGLVTNFHMPKSTLLLLISALVGEDWKKIYEFALENEYRFLSYGDSSLLLPENDY